MLVAMSGVGFANAKPGPRVRYVLGFNHLTLGHMIESACCLQLERVWWLAATMLAIGLALSSSAGFSFPWKEQAIGGIQLALGAGCAWWLIRLRPGLRAGVLLGGWIQCGMIGAGAAMMAFWAATLIAVSAYPLALPEWPLRWSLIRGGARRLSDRLKASNAKLRIYRILTVSAQRLNG